MSFSAVMGFHQLSAFFLRLCLHIINCEGGIFLKIKGILCGALCLTLLFAGIHTSAAGSPITVTSDEPTDDLETPLEAVETAGVVGQTLDIKAKSAFLMEPHSGQVLYESNADEILPPASVTKIMSLLLVMEAIDRGAFTTETVLNASEHACSMGGSQIWLEPGEAMSVDDLLKAAVIASANDATVALGEAVAGSEEGFVAMMNERAKQLGMTNTHFVNCTGLDAEGHLTTARDIGLMSAELIKHPLIKNYSTVWMDTLRDGKSELVNTNKLVRFYKGTTGLKTGTTSGAGYCLSATAERDGMELVAVIMGGETSPDRFNGAKKLLDYGFANYAFTTVTAELPENFGIPVEGGVKKSAAIKAGEPLGVLMLKTEAAELRQELAAADTLTAPVKQGDKAGVIEVKREDETVGVIKLYADENIEKKGFAVVLGWLITGLLTL